MSSSDSKYTFNAVEDIKNRLKEIDNRKRPPIKKSDVVKSVTKVLKRETSVLETLDSALTDTFSEKKLEDKKKLVQTYNLPTTPKELLAFAKFVNSEIVTKKNESDPLMYTWKEKLKEIYLYAEKNIRETEAFATIQKYYNDDKRREKRSQMGAVIFLLAGPIITAFVLSLVYELPWLLFVAITGVGWELILTLYTCGLLDSAIDSAKHRCEKKKNVPKILRVVGWHLLTPFFAAMIAAIAHQAIVISFLFLVLFLADIIFLCYLYEQ